MDAEINVDRWITVAEAVVCDVGGALNALSAASTEGTGGAEPTREGIEIHGLANLDAPGVAERLRSLAAAVRLRTHGTRLQMVATNLIHLADNVDLTGLAERLKAPTTSAIPEAIPEVLPDMVSQEVDRLLAELEEPMSPTTTEMLASYPTRPCGRI